MAQALYGRVVLVTQIGRGFPVWTHLPVPDRQVLFAVRGEGARRSFVTAAHGLAQLKPPAVARQQTRSRAPASPLHTVAAPPAVKPVLRKAAPPQAMPNKVVPPKLVPPKPAAVRQAAAKSPIPKPATPKPESRGRFGSFVAYAARRIYAAEFWIGIAAGAATRYGTRFAIEAAFAPARAHAALVELAACAGAGLAAGFAVHMVRTLYRNLTRREGAPRERYFGMGLFESAVTGLFAGLLGGDVAGMQAVAARAASLAIGAGTGATVGVFHAAISGGDGRRGNWLQRLAHGIGYGAMGGLLGSLAIDVVGPHSSAAATLSEPRLSPIDPAAASQPHIILPESCRTSLCVLPLALEATQNAPVISIHDAPLHHGDAPPSASSSAVTAAGCVPCPPHAHHHHHVRHVARHHPQRPMFDTVIVIDLPPPVPVVPVIPALPIVAAPVIPLSQPMPPPPPHVLSDCPPQERIDFQGPCAQPGVICAEHVSFNQDGEATRAILAPVAAQDDYAHFETAANDAGGSQVSLVMPLASPMPA